MKKYVIIHDVRSVHNVGSFFRTADGAGVEKIFLTGYTPAPIDRFGRARNDFIKVSLGAEKSVPWEKREDILHTINTLKKDDVHIVAVEQSPDAVVLHDYKIEGDTAYIFGNEVEGLSEDIVKSADIVLEIPMLGEKESLNVSVVGGIVLYAHNT